MRKLLILLIGFPLLLAGCGGSESGGETQELDTTLRLNLADKPSSIDPTLASEISAQKFLTGLFEPLVRLDKDTNPVPAAATEWEHNENYTSWTFHLREDGRWHNGDPVTAHDFKYAVERLLTHAEASYAGLIIPLLEGAEEYFEGEGLDEGIHLDSIKVPDDYTITYEMAAPTPYFITFVTLFSFMPLHEPTIEEHGDQWALSADSYMGNGPFKLTEIGGREYIAEKADTYWDKENVFWEEIVYRMVENALTEDSAFRTGDLDITEDVAVPEIDYWKEQPAYRVQPLFATYYVSFNLKEPPFDDVNVRKAFSKAMDRELITSQVTKRNEPVAGGIVPANLNSPRGGTYGEARGDLIGEMDVEEAKTLLENSEYGRDLPPIEYLYNSDDVHKAIGEQLQFMWKQAADVDVRLQQVEWGTFMNRAYSGNYMAARSSWVGDYLDAMSFLEIFTTGNTKNAPQYSNPEYDELIEQARHETDPVAREDLMIEAERILIEEDCVVAPIYTYISPILVSTDIEGFDRNLLDHYLYTRARRVRENN